MPADQRRVIRLCLVLLAAALVLGLWWWASQPTPDPAANSGGSTSSAPGSVTSPVRDTSGLAAVQVADLPLEARRTLDLIAAGGPYPYSRDGVVFRNRERLLPRRASGYYHEYTVPTPGEDDRGARRIITGKAGERYWTADHYGSFRVIRDGGR
jgi:ribonuclease T1